MLRVLIVSDSPSIRTGQARVVRAIVNHMVESPFYDVACAGWFHGAAPAQETAACEVFPCPKDRPETIGQIIEHVRPDVVLAVGDPHDFGWIAANKGATRLVGYLNIDAEPLPWFAEGILDSCDRLAVSSEFARGVIDRRDVEVIPFGVDRTIFRRVPLPERQWGRDLSQTFVVFVNAQNTLRKNIAAAVRGFARFAKNYADQDVLMFINTKVTPGPDDAPGVDLGELVFEEDIRDLVRFETRNQGPLQCMSDEELNVYYNLASCLLVTSANEGFCLPILEAMATNTVPIAPDAHATRELVANGRGIPMPIDSTYRTSYGTDAEIVSPATVEAALIDAYVAWKQRHQPGVWREYLTAGSIYSMESSWERMNLSLDAFLGGITNQPVRSAVKVHAGYRRMARTAARAHGQTYGLLKLGGLGDVLQATRVVHEATKVTGLKATVFSNARSAPEIFSAMPEVESVVSIDGGYHDLITRSLAEPFELFFDVRYISRVMRGIDEASPWPQGSAFFRRHRWFYDNWAGSNARIDTLGEHTTRLMLKSLGLEWRESIDPIFSSRAPVPPGLPEEPFLVVASGSTTPLKCWHDWPRFDPGMPMVQIGGLSDPRVPRAIDLRDDQMAIAVMASILERSAGLVSVDNGIAHLARATETPAIVIFGPTSGVAFGYAEHINIVAEDAGCPPCFWLLPTWGEQTCAIGEPRCANLPTAREVLEQVPSILAATRQRVTAA